MALVFEPADERPTEAEVADFEREIGFRLPPAFRAFLLTHNGGKFPHLVSVTAPAGTVSGVIWHLEFHGRAEPPVGGYEDRFMLNSLYCLGRSWRDPMRDLREVYKVSLDWAHPRELLPIGHDPGNNQYFLRLSGRRAGAILLAGETYGEKYYNEQFEAITPDDYALLAENFEAFLDGLSWCAHRVEPVAPPERVSHPTQGQVLAWLRSDNSDTQVAGLRAIPRREFDIDTFWSEFPHLLRAGAVDVRWLAADLLLKNAHSKDIGTFVPHLEALFDDLSNPSWLRSAKGDGFALGRVARRAVAQYCVHHHMADRLRELIAQGGRAAADALSALRSAADPNLIVPLLPVLAQAQRLPEARLRQSAATALAHLHWLNRSWGQLRELVLSDDEAVRLGAIGQLDDLAEAGRDDDVAPLVPDLLAFFAQREGSFKRTREAAARVLAWLVMNKQPSKKDDLGLSHVDIPQSFVLNSVDLLAIPEIKTQLEEP